MTFKKNCDSILITGGGLLALGSSPIINNRAKKGNYKMRDTNLSHNIYSDEIEITSTNSCKYLILIENERRTEIIPCTCLSTAIEIASNEHALCRLFERRGSMGKQWTYLCDVSRGVI